MVRLEVRLEEGWLGCALNARIGLGATSNEFLIHSPPCTPEGADCSRSEPMAAATEHSAAAERTI